MCGSRDNVNKCVGRSHATARVTDWSVVEQNTTMVAS